MFDYQTLKLVWWVIIVLIIIGFIVMDGQAFGVGIMLPFLGENEVERDAMIGTVAPHWEGNQVWLIISGGGLIAIWPTLYGVALSSVYRALMLILFSLLLRPLAFEYRSKIKNIKWYYFWDWALFIGCFIPTFMLGVIAGNLFFGIDFYFDDYHRTYSTNSFLSLFNPFGIFFGIMLVLFFCMQGCAILLNKQPYHDDVALSKNTHKTIRYLIIFILLGFTLGGFWLAQIEGFAIDQIADINSALNPNMKQVSRYTGAWLDNFHHLPILWIFPFLAYVGGLVVWLASKNPKSKLPIIGSSLVGGALVWTVAIALFPFVYPSSGSPNISLTLWDATASYQTLNILFWLAITILPIVIAYTIWAYKVMNLKKSEASKEHDTTSNFY